MPWGSVPTFSDGSILTAAQLNQLGAAAQYLLDLGTAPMPGILQQTTTSTSTYADTYWLTRYTNRYLHVITNADDHGKLKVTVNGNIVINITTLPNGYSDSVADCNALGLTVGTFYPILVQYTTASGTNRLCYVAFTSSATALV